MTTPKDSRDYSLADDPCPLCGTPLRDDAPIAISCPNEECPVEDDCDLWYIASDGTWKRQHWIEIPMPDRPHWYRLVLSEKE